MGNVRLYGATSGYTELAPPAVAPDGVLTLPSGTGTIAKTTDQGLVHINTTTFSAVSSVSINNCFSSTYENYFFIFRCNTTAAGPEVRFRLRVSGSDASGANYIYEERVGNSYSTALSQTSFRIGQTSADGGGLYVFANIYRPFLTQQTGYNTDATELISNIRTSSYGGEHSLTTSYDGMTFFSTGPANNIAGTFRVYGYKNGA